MTTFNARAETVATKALFRDAFKRTRRLIPASGYYEWQNTLDGKQPWYFTTHDGSPLTFAGLWDEWRNRIDPIEVSIALRIVLMREGVRMFDRRDVQITCSIAPNCCLSPLLGIKFLTAEPPSRLFLSQACPDTLGLQASGLRAREVPYSLFAPHLTGPKSELIATRRNHVF